MHDQHRSAQPAGAARDPPSWEDVNSSCLLVWWSVAQRETGAWILRKNHVSEWLQNEVRPGFGPRGSQQTQETVSTDLGIRIGFF